MRPGWLQTCFFFCCRILHVNMGVYGNWAVSWSQPQIHWRPAVFGTPISSSASEVVGWLWLTGNFGASGIFLLKKLVQHGNVDFHTDVFVLQDWASSQHFICWSHIMEISGSDWTQLYTVAQRKKKKRWHHLERRNKLKYDLFHCR